MDGKFDWATTGVRGAVSGSRVATFSEDTDLLNIRTERVLRRIFVGKKGVVNSEMDFEQSIANGIVDFPRFDELVMR